jgi:hypothetical protein
MNPAQDTFYRVRQSQAECRGQTALPYDEFCAWLRENHETDLKGLLLPPSGVKVHIRHTPKLNLDRLCITPNAATAVPADETVNAVARHAAGDWGTLGQNDWQENDKALRCGGRLFSVYQASNGTRFYVITESDRVTTTVLRRRIT